MDQTEEESQKTVVPLLRVHNQIINNNSDRPIITYYRVNGNGGRMEESFRIVATETFR